LAILTITHATYVDGGIGTPRRNAARVWERRTPSELAEVFAE